jgi:hypothetical protein
MTLWMLKCLGAPASLANRTAGAAFAALGILAAGALTFRLLRRRTQPLPAECLLLGVMMISLGSAAMLAVGRLSDYWSVPRYQTPVLLFWLSLTLLALLAFRGSPGKQHPGSIGVMLLASLWLAAVLYPAHLKSTDAMAGFVSESRLANTAILMGTKSRTAYEFVLPFSDNRREQDKVILHRSYLVENRLGVFADGHHELIDRSMEDVYPKVREGLCTGALKPRLTGKRQHKGLASVSGRGRGIRGATLEDVFVIATPNGKIVGLARTLASKFDPFNWWRGVPQSFNGFSRVESKSINIFAIAKNGTACPIARDVAIR